MRGWPVPSRCGSGYGLVFESHDVNETSVLGCVGHRVSRFGSLLLLGGVVVNTMHGSLSVATHLRLAILRGSTSENSAPFLQHLTCQKLDGKPETLISRLQYLRDLRDVDLRNSETLNYVNLGRLMELGQIRALEVLVLADTDLKDADCEVYASTLQSGRVEGLSQIDFSGNSISGSGAAALARAFQSGHGKNLQEIYLSSSRIGDDGMDALASAFASGHKQKLEQVGLADNRIGDKGMVHLAIVLETGKLPSLHFLDLAGNKVGLTGITRLAKALESGNLSSWRSLDLYNCNSNDQELEALVQSISNHTSLMVDIFTGRISVVGRLRRLCELNTYHVQVLSAVGDRKVPAKFEKVYLCGNPLVGKTTLKRSLERSILRSLFTSEAGKHEEARTRGIDVYQMTSKGGHGNKKALSLALWDGAGQYDYHIVHNTFLTEQHFPKRMRQYSWLCVHRQPK